MYPRRNEYPSAFSNKQLLYPKKLISFIFLDEENIKVLLFPIKTNYFNRK